MAIATDIITTARLREAIGASGDEDDDLLEGFRDSAIDWIERYTHRTIVDRTITTGAGDFYFSGRREPDWIRFRASDVKDGDLAIGYVNHDDDPQGARNQTLTIATGDSRVLRDQDGVRIYSGEGNVSWRDVMRFNDPFPALTAARGMDAASIPKAWGSAVALIVRALFDGSAYDDLGTNSALQLLMRPYRCSPYGRSART